MPKRRFTDGNTSWGQQTQQTLTHVEAKDIDLIIGGVGREELISTGWWLGRGNKFPCCTDHSR